MYSARRRAASGTPLKPGMLVMSTTYGLPALCTTVTPNRSIPSAAPQRRVMSLREHRLADRRQRRQLGRVAHHVNALARGAARQFPIRLDHERAVLERGTQLVDMGGDERLRGGHARRLEDA